jgi:hypothetical protein
MCGPIFRRRKIFSFSRKFQTVFGATLQPVQWLPSVPYPEVKRPKREVKHLPPFSYQVKNEWIYSYTSTFSPQSKYAVCLAVEMVSTNRINN